MSAAGAALLALGNPPPPSLRQPAMPHPAVNLRQPAMTPLTPPPIGRLVRQTNNQAVV